MRRRFDRSFFKKALPYIVAITVVKSLWIAVEWIWLPVHGVDYLPKARMKPLFYPVKLVSEASAPVLPKPKVKVEGNISSIKLLAIYHADDNDVVTVRYRGKTEVLGRGESVGGFTLVGGGNDFALFEKGGKHYKVRLQKIKGLDGAVSPAIPEKTPMSTSSGMDDNADGIVDAGDHKVVDRELIKHYTTHMNEIYKNIGLADMRTSGSLEGFKVTFVRRGTPFAKLGLRRGDILKAINGQPLDSYKAAFDAYKNILKTENVTLQIQRGDQEMELNYEID